MAPEPHLLSGAGALPRPRVVPAGCVPRALPIAHQDGPAAGMRRVLFVSYFFPPLANSGTYRSLKFVRYLREFGWDPFVVTAEPSAGEPVDPTLMAQVPRDTRILRVPLQCDRIGRYVGRALDGLVDGARVAGAVSWRLRALQQTPDPYACWRGPATREALRAFRTTGCDVVFATGYPWSALLAGCDLARALDVPFVADFRDPWTADDVLRGPLSLRERRLHEALEGSVLAAASVVVVVNDRLADVMRGLGARNVVTIPNGYDEDDLAGVEPDERPAIGRLRVAYAGVWKDGYGPAALYEAVARLMADTPSLARHLEVVTAGFAPGPAAAKGVASIVRERGVLSHRDALALMRGADVLILPLAAGSHQRLQVPGKLYEYLATGRPVVALADRDGAAADLLARAGGGVRLDPDDIDGLTGTLREACALGRLAVPPLRRDVLETFRRRPLTGRLAAVFDALAPDKADAPFDALGRERSA